MYSLLKSNPFLLFSQEFQPLQGIAVCDGRLERLPQGVFLVEAKKALHPFSMDASTSWRWTWSGAFSSHAAQVTSHRNGIPLWEFVEWCLVGQR